MLFFILDYPPTSVSLTTPRPFYSTGAMNRIQVSQTTASLLFEAGKESWLHQRDDQVVAKGKGVLSTCWLVPTYSGASEGHTGLLAMAKPSTRSSICTLRNENA